MSHPCPVCTGRIGWKTLVRWPMWPFYFRCRSCGTRLRMADPGQSIEAVVVGLIPAAAVILIARNRGWFETMATGVLVAVMAGAAAGCGIVWWIGRRAEWQVRDGSAGAGESRRGYLVSVILYLGLSLAIVGAATFVLMTLGELGRGPRVNFPTAAEAVSLGTVDPGWTFQTLEGEERSFADLRGKTVFVNFWATWCPPCLAEMPSIQDLYDSLKGENIEFLLISHEPRSVVAEFIVDSDYAFPVYVAEDPPPAVLETQGIPATFILNARGEIVFQHVGMADWNTDECRRFLRELR